MHGFPSLSGNIFLTASLPWSLPPLSVSLSFSHSPVFPHLSLRHDCASAMRTVSEYSPISGPAEVTLMGPPAELTIPGLLPGTRGGDPSLEVDAAAAGGGGGGGRDQGDLGGGGTDPNPMRGRLARHGSRPSRNLMLLRHFARRFWNHTCATESNAWRSYLIYYNPDQFIWLLLC